METNRIFSADQIQIHPELPDIIKQYTKAVLKANPANINEFSWNYFKSKVEEEEAKKTAALKAEQEADSSSS